MDGLLDESFRSNPNCFNTVVRSFLDQSPEANTAEAVSPEADVQQAGLLPIFISWERTN